MKTKVLYLVVTFFLVTQGLKAQSCATTVFTPPATPSSFTYNYKDVGGTIGWYNSSDNPIAPPVIAGAGTVAGSVGIFEDLTYFFGEVKAGNAFYVAPGVTFTGTADALKDNNTIIEGTADFANTPNNGKNHIYIYPGGILTFAEDYNVSSDCSVHNAGTFNIGVYDPNPLLDQPAQLSVSSAFYSYSDSWTLVNGDIHFSGDYINCGLLETMGDIHTGGNSGFENLCASYIHGDFHMNGDYTNDGLMYFKGTVNFIGPTTFYNDGTLVFDDLNLANDQIVGQYGQSVLIVFNTATLTGGASVTGHYFYNASATPPPGGGFNSVCGTCTADVDVAIDVTVPATVDEVLQDCGANIELYKPEPKATLDFDGIDDYVSTTSFINGEDEVTMMGWVKIDPSNAGKLVTLFGEDMSCRLYLSGPNRPYFMVKTTSSASYDLIGGSSLPYDEWHHIAASFSAVTGKISIYIDGKLDATKNTGLSGTIDPYTGSTGKFEIGRISRAVADRQYFAGDIDEVRVFDNVLTDEQIQQMVYQEILNNSGNVRGTVVPKDVRDIASDTRVSWNNLMAYYPMTDIVSYTRTLDYSSYNRDTRLYNINTIVEQTAPMPYETKGNGAWTDENTWLHGNVWDIESTSTNKDWSVVRINDGHDVSSSSNHTHLGTVIAENASLTVTADRALTNSWYMELNGTLDLDGDSQLVQGINSDLVTSANGKVLRRQQANGNQFRYTYMSAPVGQQAATTLGNDNAAVNNPNNTTFSLNMLKEGDGTPVQFTNGYNGNGKLSTRWTYTFLNGITYYDWAPLAPATSINPGVGYIHKGMSSGESSLELLFEGRPNNGTILIAADDVDGDSGNESQPDVTQTTTLIGNPYPSAIDAHKFIDDNAGVIDGTIYLWQQWAGNNHILEEYQGGYAVLNKLAKIRAYQFVGQSGANNGSQDGTLTPTQYIGAGQSFMTEVIADGNIEFNNAQRIFKRESTGDVEFFRSNETSEKSSEATEEDTLSVLKLDFRLSNNLSREFVLGFSESTTMGYDYGYDAKMFDLKSNDMYTMWEGEKMIAQAYPQITADMEIPLHMVVTGDETYEISATELINLKNQEVYLWDKYNDTYFDLTTGASYGFTAEAGTYTDRFSIVFQSQDAQDTLSDEEVMLNKSVIYFNTDTDRIYIKGLTEDSRRISLIDLSGKTIHQFGEMSANEMASGLPITDISSGIYMVSVVTDTNRVINKKLIID